MVDRLESERGSESLLVITGVLPLQEGFDTLRDVFHGSLVGTGAGFDDSFAFLVAARDFCNAHRERGYNFDHPAHQGPVDFGTPRGVSAGLLEDAGRCGLTERGMTMRPTPNGVDLPLIPRHGSSATRRSPGAVNLGLLPTMNRLMYLWKDVHDNSTGNYARSMHLFAAMRNCTTTTMISNGQYRLFYNPGGHPKRVDIERGGDFERLVFVLPPRNGFVVRAPEGTYGLTIVLGRDHRAGGVPIPGGHVQAVAGGLEVTGGGRASESHAVRPRPAVVLVDSAPASDDGTPVVEIPEEMLSPAAAFEEHTRREVRNRRADAKRVILQHQLQVSRNGGTSKLSLQDQLKFTQAQHTLSVTSPTRGSR